MSSAEASSSKKRKNATKACLNCRRRKTKCEGIPPICRTCQLYKDDCTWGGDDDGRKPASRQYVQSLRQRITVLEDMLRKRGDTVPELLSGSDENDEADEDPQVDNISATLLHFQVDTAGEQVHYHGPTSSYAHERRKSSTLTQGEGLPTVIETDNAPRDYRRFLPRGIDLSAEQHSLVLDRYFRYYASWSLRGSPRLFHHDMIKAVSSPGQPNYAQTSYYSPLLHNAILSIALMFADDENLRDSNTRAVFDTEGEKYLSAELSKPTLATVQALAVRASYRSTLGDHLGGWIAHGLADRTALSIGLNIDCAPFVKSGRVTESEMRLRNETFWSIFVQDQAWAFYAGRPHPIGDYNTPLPTIDEEFDAMQWVWDESPMDNLQLKSQDCMMSRTFYETARLSIIMQKILLTVYSLQSDHAKVLKDGQISELSLELDTWHEQLPATLCLSGHSNRNALPHVLMLQMAREWAVILLHRPYYRAIVGPSRTSESSEHIAVTAMRRCDRSAGRINVLLQLYHDRFGLRFTTPTSLNIAFVAGITHLHACNEHRSHKTKVEAKEKATACVRFLRLMADSWPAAAQNADILEQSVEERAGPSTTTGTSLSKSPLGHQQLPLSPNNDQLSSSMSPNTASMLTDVLSWPTLESPSTAVESSGMEASVPVDLTWFGNQLVSTGTSLQSHNNYIGPLPLRSQTPFDPGSLYSNGYTDQLLRSTMPYLNPPPLRSLPEQTISQRITLSVQDLHALLTAMNAASVQPTPAMPLTTFAGMADPLAPYNQHVVPELSTSPVTEGDLAWAQFFGSSQ